MTLEWGETRNRANIRKHGFDFADAEEMFRGSFLFVPTYVKTMARSHGSELG
jgi:uncharacterized DUF497 family protein